MSRWGRGEDDRDAKDRSSTRSRSSRGRSLTDNELLTAARDYRDQDRFVGYVVKDRGVPASFATVQGGSGSLEGRTCAHLGGAPRPPPRCCRPGGPARGTGESFGAHPVVSADDKSTQSNEVRSPPSNGTRCTFSMTKRGGAGAAQGGLHGDSSIG